MPAVRAGGVCGSFFGRWPWRSIAFRASGVVLLTVTQTGWVSQRERVAAPVCRGKGRVFECCGKARRFEWQWLWQGPDVKMAVAVARPRSVRMAVAVARPGSVRMAGRVRQLITVAIVRIKPATSSGKVSRDQGW
jgi:hypothetical protein